MLTRDNKVEIIGTLESINVIKDTSPKTGAYLRGNLVVKVSSPKTMNIPLNFFTSAQTKDGKPRKLYGQLDTLRQGQRVSITGAIDDNKFWDQGRGQLVKGKRLNVVFVNNVGSSDSDKAEFSYSGFVKETIKEIFNQEGVTTGYTIRLAQSNYDGSRCQVIGFMVDPKNTAAVRYVTQEYTSGKTVKVSGELDYDIITETREEAVDFGKPITKTFQRNISNLIITSGVSVSEGVYEREDIDRLVAGDAADDRQVETNARGQEKSGAQVSTNKPLASTSTTNQSLL